MTKKLHRLPATIVLAAGLALAGCDEASVSEAEFIESARGYIEAGEHETAAIELRNALQTNPDNPDARFLLGEVFLFLGQVEDAENQLRRAQELGHESEDLPTLIVQANLLQRDFATVLDLVPETVDPADEATVDMAAARAIALDRSGDRAAAQSIFERILEARPHPVAYAELIRLAVARQELDRADTMIAEALAAFPGDAAVQAANGVRHLARERFADAVEAFRAAVDVDPYRFEYRIGLARALIAAQDFDAAAAYLETMLQEFPLVVEVKTLAGMAALNRRDWDLALQVGQDALDVTPDDPAALYVAGWASFSLEQYERSYRFLDRYMDRNPYDYRSMQILAVSAFRIGETDRAYEIVAQVPPTLAADPQFLSFAGTSALFAGEPEEGLGFLEEAVLAEPDNAALRTQLGLLNIAAGNLETAAANLAQALDVDPAIVEQPEFDRARMALALGFLQRGPFERALDVAEEFKAAHPDQSLGHVVEGIAHQRLGDLDAARAAFRAGLAVEPGAMDAARNLATIEARDGNIDAAYEVLSAAAEENGDPQTMIQLSVLSLQREDEDAATAWLERATELEGGAFASILLARRSYQDDRFEDTLGTLERLDSEWRDSPMVLELLGRTHQQLDQHRQAVDVLERLVQQTPTIAAPRLLLADSYAEIGDDAAMRRTLNEAFERSPESVNIRLAVAQVFLTEGLADDAAPVIASLAADLPEDPDVLEVQGRLAQLEGDAEAALDHYGRAFAAAPSEALAIRVSEAHWLSQRPDDTLAVLTSWIEDHPESVDARLRIAGFYAVLDRAADAEAQYAAVVEIAPDHGFANHELAWLMHQRGAYEPALAHAETALEALPDSGFVASTMGTILYDMGDSERALGVLYLAVQRSPESETAHVNLARTLIDMGDPEEARRVLEGFIDRVADQDQATEAQALLSSLPPEEDDTP